MEITSYRDLKVWRAAIDLAEDVLRRDAIFSGVRTLRPHIAGAARVGVHRRKRCRGHGRETTGAFIQFLRISQGSVKELETHFIIAQRLDLVSSDESTRVLDRCDELGKMLRGLIRSLQDKQSG